ncbi:MAG: protein kinase domain-containing protein [Kofleriaceae bacterium]
MHASGDLVGPYRLVSILGKGAMGEVWRARDERLDRYVALKVLPPEDAGDLERRARQLREAKAAAAIRHPNVVTLFDIVSHDGDDILVMELVEGRTLSETLRKDGAPALETALRWIVGVADALVAAHARGILHRDIKAANIMVTPDGIKVLDFGLAKLKDEVSPGSSMSGVRPAVSSDKIALDETMPSSPSSPAAKDISLAETSAPTTSGSNADSRPTNAEIESYKTQHGQLLGTPLYMAPEQIAGQLPDEKSEVFSIGVLAHEILAGKPPYAATTMDQLFRQITAEEPPPLDDVPRPLVEIVLRALAKDPAQRFPTMRELRDALAAEQRRLFSPPARRWPLFAAIAVALVAGGVSLYVWRTSRPPPKEPSRPGDDLVIRALAEYDTFYYDKSLSSLRAALAVAPDHPRANAYMVLFGGSSADQAKAVATADRTLASLPATSRDRVLLTVASTLVEKGPLAAREIFTREVTARDRELAFWAAELDYRAGNFAVARDAYQALLADPSPSLRGRIYDHYSSVLLYVDEPDEALRIGTLYRDAFPGEADAVGVYATTLAAAGRSDEAIIAAEQALSLAEGEDTLAGLAKVLALAGQRERAMELYRQSLERAGATRRPIRRAALALLQLAGGDAASAKETTAPCLGSGADAKVRERGACLFVAALADPISAESIARELDALAAEATPVRPAYGAPASLASLVRARMQFFGGGCVLPPAPVATPPEPALIAAYDVPVDFYAKYHLPFFGKYAACEKAALLRLRSAFP